MSVRALITVADGVEELECVTLIDVLRRAEVEVLVASIEGRRMVTCAHGTRLTADAMLVDVLAQDFDLIVLPGGMPGAQRLADHQPLAERVQQQARSGLLFAAICAELLASRMEGEPLPVEDDLARAVDPARFPQRKPRRTRRGL